MIIANDRLTSFNVAWQKSQYFNISDNSANQYLFFSWNLSGEFHSVDYEYFTDELMN